MYTNVLYTIEGKCPNPYITGRLAIIFILSLMSASVEATANTHDTLISENPTQRLPDKALSWTDNQTQTNDPAFCLVPSEPGCNRMWMDEKKRENNERIERRKDKSRYPRRE